MVAATLLDLKAARLLPTGDVEDEEDIAILEARDLLFARLLQYRAYKEVAALFAARMATRRGAIPVPSGRTSGSAACCPRCCSASGRTSSPAWPVARLAPKPAPPTVGLAHLHAAQVSVREQATLIATRLQRLGHATFRALVADCDTTVLVVGRFLAVLELYREGRGHVRPGQPARASSTCAGPVRAAATPVPTTTSTSGSTRTGSSSTKPR